MTEAAAIIGMVLLFAIAGWGLLHDEDELYLTEDMQNINAAIAKAKGE